MEIKLPNGLVINGTQTQIEETMKKLGYDSFTGSGDYYFSGSKGLVKISSMETTHLKNAILKMYKTWLDNLYMIMSPYELSKAIENGPTDSTLAKMVIELRKRRA